MKKRCQSMNLEEQYGIACWERQLVNCCVALKGKGKIPKYIMKRSAKRYGVKLSLTRYFMHRYRHIPVGKYTYGFEQFYSQGDSIESIGAFCSIANNVNLTAGNHPMDRITTHPISYLKAFGMLKEDCQYSELNRKIEIGNDVWIGRDVTILPGVKIGNGAVIGAGALVNRDVPDYAVVVGVPAKVIKYRFTPERIVLLNEVQWWKWSDAKICEWIDDIVEPERFFARLAMESR